MVAEADKPTPVALSNVTTLVGSPVPSNPASPFLTAEGPEDKAKLSAASRTTLVASELPEAKEVDASAPEPTCERVLKIEDFRVIRVLGEGGQGLVMLVHDKLTNKLFALKAIKKEVLPTKDFLTAFVEQNIMQTFAGNPFFTALKGSFEDDDHFYLITDYLSGGDLSNRIRKQGKLPNNEARRYAAQIILGMEELRRQRIIHRDIKPQNILLNAQDEAIISDFGLARTFGRTDIEEDGDELEPSLRKDQTQAACGTFGYIPPEMFESGTHSYEADVWSFAVTLYEMLHGKLPFGYENREMPTNEAISHVVLDAVEIDDHVDPDANDLLQAMLAKDPMRRPTWEQIKEHPWFDAM
ncbi:kinase-like domain-containing protein [Cubamyces lactineus]|nr:kinase-like domain-containing protein [Cubamyces lactineus]